MKKIIFDVRSLMNRRYSGVSFYTLNLLKTLLPLDQENNYTLFYNSSRQVDLPALERNSAVYAGYNFSNKLFNSSIALTNWPKVDQMLGGADLIFAPNLNFIGWSKECHKIAVVHDLSFLRFPEFFDVKMRLWHWLANRRGFYHQADLLIADSYSTKNDLIELLGVKENKIRVVHLGVTEDFQPIDRNSEELIKVREKYGLPEKFVLYLGTLEPRKNVAGIIKAFNAGDFGDYHLVIAGGDGWKSSDVFSLAKDNAKIKFVGYVADRIALYNLADLFIYPSYYEGFGLPLLEAMACGCPVIGGANSSQPEVVGSAGLIVDSHNISEISQAMKLMLFEPGLRESFVAAGFEQAKKFTWKKTAEETLTVINEFK